jgi:hypothetical protein
MAIPSVAATPPSLFSIPSIEAMQGMLLVRRTESRVFVGNLFPTTDIVELSETSQLLSTVSQIADAAEAAEQGVAIDTEAVLESAQDFVDSVNAVNIGNEFALSSVIDTGIVPEPDTLQAEALNALGISVLPIDSGGDNFILSLDTQALETALLADPTETTEQLAAAAAPIATAAAAQATTATIVAAGVTQDAFALAAAGVPAAALLTSQLTPQALAEVGTVLESLPPVPVPVPVVPDLTVENADLRRALADTALSDIVSAITSSADEPADSSVTALAATNAALAEAALAAQSQAIIAATVPDADEPAPANTLSQARSVTGTTSQVAPTVSAERAVDQALLLNAAADAQAQATLSPSELLTTPLEQITRLALNPTLAGAVAAFQIPMDDGGRNARVAFQSAFDVVNPMEAVLQTEAISPNLANTSEQRREGSTDSRLSQWLATRPGLI